MSKYGNKAQKLNYLRPAMNVFQNLARKQKSLATPALECHIFVEWTCLSLSLCLVISYSFTRTHTHRQTIAANIYDGE